MTHQEAIDTLAAERYLLDEMAPDERSAFEEHFFDCDACADDMRSAAAMVKGAKAGFAGVNAAGSKPPATRGTFTWSRSVVLPWAAAATLALVAGYQAFWLIPSLRRDDAVALAPITLHPASRGAEAVVPLAHGSRAVTLAVDGIESPDRTIRWTLSTTDGRVVTSGDAPTPPPGAPLLLLMPSWTLTDAMHYILAFREPPDTGRSLGEYRFAVSTQ
jgi:hypothetical protein